MQKKGENMEIINKLGGYKKVVDVLVSNGWKSTNPYGTLVIQNHRKNLSKDVSLILWDYCNKNGIKVKPEDFKGE